MAMSAPDVLRFAIDCVAYGHHWRTAISTAVPRHLRPLSPEGGALEADREILGRVETGDGPGAEQLLADYLDKAQEQLVDAYAQQTAAGE